MRVLLVSEGKHELSGALKTLVQRIMQRDDLEFNTDRASRNDIHAFHGRGQGFFKRSIRWLLEAKRRGCDALVFLIDEDGFPDRIQQINRAQAHERITHPRAFGVAIKTFDAWMLADEQTLTKVLVHQVTRQPDPETIRDPKNKCATLISSSNRAISHADMYDAVAKDADLDIVEERCPRGFRPFAQRVRNL